MTLDVSMVTAPTRNPVSPPKATPAMMVSAMTGLNWGSMKNAARPATPMAQSTAMITSLSLIHIFNCDPVPKIYVCERKGNMQTKLNLRKVLALGATLAMLATSALASSTSSWPVYGGNANHNSVVSGAPTSIATGYQMCIRDRYDIQ